MKRLRRVLDRPKERELVRANWRALQNSYAVGSIVERDWLSGRWRVTRVVEVPTTPEYTYIVYGVPVS